MSRDPMVDLIFSHFIPRYVATGVDPNDLQRMMTTIEQWSDWCRIWSEEAKLHENHAAEAASKGHKVTASESYLRAAIYYHYGKHLFANPPEEFRTAHDNMLRCYTLAAPDCDPPMQRLVIPFNGAQMFGWLRVPKGVAKPPVAIVLPGLDACKEELHAWTDAFIKRGLATLTLDGPGQGETSFLMPISTEWGRAIGAVIDVLEKRNDVDAGAVGIVGQSLGAFYAPLAAAGEPRLKACIANCGPFDFAPVIAQMPEVSKQVFRARAHAKTQAEADAVAKTLTLDGVAKNIRCPLLIVFGGNDKLVPPSEGERLAKSAGGPVEFVTYADGNHVCFNISYKFRPLTGDWMAEKLRR